MLDEKMEEEIRVRRVLNPFTDKREPMRIEKRVNTQSEQDLEARLQLEEEMQLDNSQMHIEESEDCKDDSSSSSDTHELEYNESNVL